MTAREYLQEIKDIRYRIDQIVEEEKDTEINILRAREIKDDKVKESLEPDSLENEVIGYIEKWQRLLGLEMERREELKDRRVEAMGIIEKIKSDKQRSVLIMRYLRGWTWERITDEMQMSDTNSAHHLHKRALESFENLYDNNKNVH